MAIEQGVDDILRIWESGQAQHPLDRALTMLQGNRPGQIRSQLAALPIAERDELLFQRREQWFGTRVEGYARCPQCREEVEFTLSTGDIRVAPQLPEKHMELEAEGITIRFRLPDSRDLAVAAVCEDMERACRLLVRRCITGAAREGDPVDTRQLPEPALAALVKEIDRCQQQTEVLLNLHCPACDSRWNQVFDIAAFLWHEIFVKARRLLSEISTLAFAYHWSEADILALSPMRRQFYLEAVTP